MTETNRWMNANLPDIIDECLAIVQQHLFDVIGRKNIVSVIITGSVARNQATYKYIDGHLYLESDLDLVVVVHRMAIIKSLILIKRLATRLNSELRKKYFLSHVSLSVTTEKQLLRAGPSIFYQDLNLNGKVVSGKQLCGALTHYQTREIPAQDIYRLIFNRMVEALEALVSSGAIEKKITRDGIDLILEHMGKLTLALIQASLIKEGILVLSSSNLRDLEFKNFQHLQNSDILNELLASYAQVVNLRKTEGNCSVDEIEKYWVCVIRQVIITIERLACINNISPSSVAKLFGCEGLGQRLRFSLIIFLQYCGLHSIIDLLRAIVYIIRFGSTHFYVLLYELFLASALVMMDYGKNTEVIFRPPTYNDGKPFKVHDRQLWLKSFKEYLKAWKFITGA